jgi:hypothetical protein
MKYILIVINQYRIVSMLEIVFQHHHPVMGARFLFCYYGTFKLEELMINVVAYWLKARIVEPAATAIARERLCKQMPVARQWLSDCHIIAATIPHATIAELLEVVFTVWFALRLYKEDQLRVQVRLL